MRKIGFWFSFWLSLTLTFSLTLTSSAQTVKKLRVYQQGGVVDTLRMQPGSTVSHSSYDMNGVPQSDFVTMEVTNDDGIRRFPLAKVDSLVLPNGRTVVFRGYVNVNEDENEDENQNEDDNGSLQAMRSRSSARSLRRTSFDGIFPGGSKVTFYWTENDRIRLETGQESRAKNLSADKANASFFFDDFEEGPERVVVYYPDRKVTIATVQNQNSVDNTEHIGASGDCGVGIATKNENQNQNENVGGYSFALQHQVAYLCFLPRIAYLPSVRVTSIDVTCNAAIAGTYQLSEAGLFNGENTSKTITLNLEPHPQRVDQDFFLTHTTETAQAATASYMVIAPQAANSNFTVVYHLVDTLSRYTTTHTQTFSFRPLANRVYPVTCNIPESLFRNVDLGYDYVWSNVNLGSTLPNEPGEYYTYQASLGAMTDGWQMPTEDAKSELQKCTWTWGTFNGTDGWFVEGTNNGNDDVGVPRIFIPLTGYKEGSNLVHSDMGYYWMDSGLGNESEAQNAVIVSRNEKTKQAMLSSLAMNTRPVQNVPRTFNIPSSGRNYVDLRAHGPGYNIKVYDHGGPNGYYANGVSGFLQITCAEGYKLNVTGSVDTEGADHLLVYDVTESGNVELANKSGRNNSINVTTKGNVMLLYFYTDGSVVYPGLDLTVTIQKSSLQYAVTIPEVDGGTLTADVYSANPEDTIVLTAVPASGYVLEHIRVATDGKVLTLYEDDPKLFQNPASASRHYLMCDSVRVRDGNWYHDVSHFLMPYSDVVITPYFVKADSTLEVTMAGNDTTFIEQKYMQRLIDNGMTKFRFYDYAGKNGNYMDNNVNGYMLVHAPVGYKLNVAGQTWTEGGCDPLNIHDGYTTGYQSLASVGGNSSFNVTTNNNVAFLHFHTDGSVVDRAGYAATVTMVPDTRTQYNIPANTTLTLTEEHMAYLLAHNVTSMPVYSASGTTAYASSSNGTLRFLMPEGYQVRVSGTVGTESGYDWLRVYDAGVEKIYLSGPTQTFSYTCRDLSLKFHSDGSGVGDNKMELTVEFIAPTPSGE